jgi:hypothetical protein
MCCLFYNEHETVSHLFFECCVAKPFWKQIAEVCGKSLGADFQSVAKWWLHDKKNENYQCVHHCSSLGDLETRK